MSVSSLKFEIIVADDGSDDIQTIKENERINEMINCRYVVRSNNIGRAAIRNLLGSMASFDWLLFLDSDVIIENTSFIINYLNAPEKYPVVYGGVKIGIDTAHSTIKGNLRYMYEKQCEPHHSARLRASKPYRSFRTTNFMIMKEAFAKCQFDNTITTYGYEDVLFGKHLCDNKIDIMHIDNPVTYTEYDSNKDYMAKTEESLRTLDSLYDELKDYSGIIKLCSYIHRFRAAWLVKKLFLIMSNDWKRRLESEHPSLLIYKMYKIGYFISVHRYP